MHKIEYGTLVGGIIAGIIGFVLLGWLGGIALTLFFGIFGLTSPYIFLTGMVLFGILMAYYFYIHYYNR